MTKRAQETFLRFKHTKLIREINALDQEIRYFQNEANIRAKKKNMLVYDAQRIAQLMIKHGENPALSYIAKGR